MFWTVLSVCVCMWVTETEKEIHPSFPDGVSHGFFLSHLLYFLGKFTNLLLHSSLELPASKPNNSMDIYLHLNISLGISNATC